MRCDEVREMLPAYAGNAEGDLTLRRHLARCSDCRAEMERYELLTGAMSELSGAYVEPSQMLVRSLNAIPTSATRTEAVRRHVARHKKRYATTGIAVALIGATGAAVLARRPRPT